MISSLLSHRVGKTSVLAAAIFVTGWAAMALVSSDRLIPLVWPPAGVALAGLLLGGWRLWPGILLGVLAAAFTAGEGNLVGLGVAAGSTATTLLIWVLMSRYAHMDLTLNNTRDTVLFIVAGALIGPALSASVRLAVMSLSQGLPTAAFGLTWVEWWLSESAGVLLFGPLLLLWLSEPGLKRLKRYPWEAGLLLIAIVFIGALAESLSPIGRVFFTLEFMALPFLIRATLRFGLKVALCGVLLLGVMDVLVLRGNGILLPEGAIAAQVSLWGFFIAVVPTLLLLAALVASRDRMAEAAAREYDFGLQITRTMSNGLIVIGRDGRVEYTNPAAAQMLRSRPEALVGLQPSEILPDDQQSIITQTFLRRGPGQPVAYDALLKRRDGSLFEAIVTGAPRTRGGEHTGTIVSITDLTALRSTEAALRRTEAESEAFLEGMKQLQFVAVELVAADEVDELCRLAVMLGRERLGFDRLAVWLANDDLTFVHGTYGTDEQGLLRREHGNTIQAPRHLLQPPEGRAVVMDNTQLWDHQRMPVGQGWIIEAPMLDGARPIGLLTADNLLRQQPLKLYEPELLSLFGNILGHLVTRKRGEAILEASERRLRAIFEGTGIGIEVVDKRGRFLYVNPALEQMLGYEQNELLQLDFASITDPEDREVSLNHFEKLHDSERSGYTVEKRFLRKNGQSVWARVNVRRYPGVSSSGEYAIGIIENITNLKRTMLDLETSETRFRLVYEAASVGIVLTDEHGRIALANPAFQAMLGMGEGELWRRVLVYELTSEEDRPISEYRFRRLMAGEVERYSIEQRFLRAGGSMLWARVNVSRFRRDEMALVIFMVEDISPRKQAEVALMRLNEELEQRVEARTAELEAANERLQELDRLKTKFIADVTHELRTPLTVLNSHAFLLEHSPPEKQPTYLRALKDHIKRLTDFVNTTLDLSRLELGKDHIVFSSVDLRVVARQVVDALVPRAEAVGLRMRLEVDDDMPHVRGEFNQLAQVVTNLVANAINYTEQGEVIVQIRGDASDQTIFLEVTDTGMGIAEEDLPHIFTRFYRGVRAGQTTIPGTGLGLSIVYEIVSLHMGTIEVNSELGKGTTFRVRLPAEQQYRSAAAAVE